MIVTEEQLRKLGACKPAVRWFKKQSTNDLLELYELVKVSGHFSWAEWYIVQILTHEQRVKMGLFVAKKILPFFEEKEPNNNWPHLYIEQMERGVFVFQDNPFTVSQHEQVYLVTQIISFMITVASLQNNTESLSSVLYFGSCLIDDMREQAVDYVLRELLHEI